MLTLFKLGAFGFLGGPTFGAEGKGTENAGLLDQRFALDWVQKYICEFGGNPKDVTVMGESSGAAGILYHITAYGGTHGPAPFRQAIMQSPAYSPISHAQRENEYLELLNYTKVNTLEQLRALDTKTLQEANNAVCRASKPGIIRFGGAPSVDGTYVTAPATRNILEGKFDKSLNVMVGVNSDEVCSVLDDDTQAELISETGRRLRPWCHIIE